MERARRIPVADGLRPAVVLDRVDYADSYRVAAHGEQSAQVWLRTAIADCPAALRGLIRAVWTVFGAEMHDGPGRVFGCRLVELQPELARVDVVWRTGLRGNIVVRTGPGAATLGTFVRLEHRFARVMWRCVSPLHRVASVLLLSLAARRLAGSD